ncbi:acetyl-CoA carboxylase biotin carboxyl carrier protein subunit [Pseudomonas graminis]|uniref:acetyl-CoA carboxylase biotin carboxyl carrier protein subunit n=1 Tax=Pseudomonas graminis TaxID=158627 RepID=UPI0023496C35|nr:acetyl-CoA carboxylase biotin carboxyl carrier protein subunit [Pseudomonas graminis]MDC6378836.1 acetyl-CoA carboxylase biotin carboxyl carrier protein subunit [Pseudomonas graminis]
MSRSSPTSRVTTLAGSVEGDAGTAQVHIEDLGNQSYQAVFADGSALLLDILRQDELPHDTTRLALKIDGKHKTVHITAKGAHQSTLDYAGSRREVNWHSSKRREGEGTALRQDVSATLLAPMPARVMEILVSEDTTVDESQPLLRIEAMKMVMTLSAPGRRRIKALHINQDDSVLAGQLLITFSNAD